MVYDGKDLTTLKGEALRSLRTKLQMIFQDPISSLNPRRKVEDIVAEGLRIWKIGTDEERQAKVDEVLEAVGLDPATARGRRPHQFSGGQCQRISIARAVITEPDLIICDEPVSALDVSVQAQILNLLEDLKERYGLTLVFIAHDLAVVKNVSDRVAVMYLGRMCEVGPPDILYRAPGPPLHRGPAGSHPRARPGPARPSAGAARRRAPVPAVPAQRLPLPHPVPTGRPDLHRRGAGDGPDRRRPLRGLPPPPRRRARHPRRRVGRGLTGPVPEPAEPWPPGRPTPASTRRSGGS